MNWQNRIAPYSPESTGQVILLAAQPGQSRRDRLQQWVSEAQQQGATTWFLSCDRNEGGIWAGLSDLLSSLLPEIQTHAPDLLVKHDYELVHVLPVLRRTISVRHLSLIDAPPAGEPHLTYYPPDRVLRIVHGIINLLKAWQQRSGGSPWVIVCDRYDHAGSLVRHFLAELMRRAGEQLHLNLLITTESEASKTVTSEFNPQYLKHYVRLHTSRQSTTPVSPQEMAQLAQELGSRLQDNEIEQERHLPRLIHYWLSSVQPENALTYQIQALLLYSTRGFYEDAVFYGEAALAQLERFCPEDQQKRWTICEKLHDCYSAMQRYVQAAKLLELAVAQTDDPDHIFRACNRLAMLDSRYLRNQIDLAKAEAHLQRGLQELERLNLPEEIKFYKTALNRRGLALIRHGQGKFAEAVKICIATYEETISRFGANKYLGHQALLLFNISRVYASIAPYDQAVAYLTAAINLDPHYSEYYNHRGNLYLKMGSLDEALHDYLKAIELSPPYPEVWTNLGQCYRLMERMAEAVDAYSNSLDLDPNQSLALVGRAQAFEMLEQPEAALADYTAALAINPKQHLILANRAILYYDAERYQEALDDLDQAIALSPETADLHQNRAVAFTALGHLEEAVQDLATYLRLNPDAGDRSEVESRLLALQGNGTKKT